MGQSGTFTGGINGNHYRLRVDWEAEQNISGNYSTVICRMYLEQDRYYSLNIGSRSSTTTIDGVGLNYSSAAINNDGGTTVSLGTVSRTVPHESDGTKIISISSNFYINATIKGVKYTYVYADSGSITLNTIPRKSAVSCPAEVNVDSSLPITISPHSSAFRHTLTYQLAGGNVQSIDTQLGGGVYSWSTAGLARQMPETAKKTCTITCITYSGSTEIGREPVTCQVIVPDNTSYKPVLKDTDIKISDAAGYHTTYGSYVQGKSRLRIVLSAAGKEGSPIRSGTVTVGETTLNGLDVTTPPLSEKGNVTVKATVTDGRGHPSAEASRTIAVLPYSAPSLSRLSVERCTETGVPDDEGGYAKIRFDYTFSNLNDLNKGYITIQKRQEEATSWTDVVTNVQLNGYTGSYELAEPTVCDPDKAFDIQVSIHDTVTTSDLTLAAMLPTAKTVFDILADGTGFAFGKVASRANALDCAWDLWIKGVNVSTLNGLLKCNGSGVLGSVSMESGTWTPVLQGYSGTNPSVIYNERYGDYTRIGPLVFFRCHVSVKISSPGSGYSMIGGLPFASYPIVASRLDYAASVGECYGILTGVSESAGTTAVVMPAISAIAVSEANGGTMRKWSVGSGAISISGLYYTSA